MTPPQGNPWPSTFPRGGGRSQTTEASQRKWHQAGYPAFGIPRGTEVMGRLAGTAAEIGMAAVTWPARLRLPVSQPSRTPGRGR